MKPFFQTSDSAALTTPMTRVPFSKSWWEFTTWQYTVHKCKIFDSVDYFFLVTMAWFQTLPMLRRCSTLTRASGTSVRLATGPWMWWASPPSNSPNTTSIPFTESTTWSTTGQVRSWFNFGSASRRESPCMRLYILRLYIAHKRPLDSYACPDQSRWDRTKSTNISTCKNQNWCNFLGRGRGCLYIRQNGFKKGPFL